LKKYSGMNCDNIMLIWTLICCDAMDASCI
jgi:hypothetical protein